MVFAFVPGAYGYFELGGIQIWACASKMGRAGAAKLAIAANDCRRVRFSIGQASERLSESSPFVDDTPMSAFREIEQEAAGGFTRPYKISSIENKPLRQSAARSPVDRTL